MAAKIQQAKQSNWGRQRKIKCLQSELLEEEEKNIPDFQTVEKRRNLRKCEKKMCTILWNFTRLEAKRPHEYEIWYQKLIAHLHGKSRQFKKLEIR